MKTETYKDITEKLEQGVEKVFQSNEYKNWLKFCSKFYNYSLNNQLLIYLQKPKASMVAGFTKWKSLGRKVEKGEKGIMIISPAPYKKDVMVKYEQDGEEVVDTETHTFMNYKAAYVFDVSQTSGKEIPSISPMLLTEQVKDYEKIKQAIVNASPIPVSFEDLKKDGKGPNGYFIPAKLAITVHDDLSEAQTLKTLIHEIAHSILDYPASDKEKIVDRSTAEVRAESVAFLVCDRLGLDTSDYTFKYVAGWSHGNDTKTLKENLDVIKKTSDQIYQKIENELDLNKDQSIEEKLDLAKSESVEKHKENVVER